MKTWLIYPGTLRSIKLSAICVCHDNAVKPSKPTAPIISSQQQEAQPYRGKRYRICVSHNSAGLYKKKCEREIAEVTYTHIEIPPLPWLCLWVVSPKSEMGCRYRYMGWDDCHVPHNLKEWKESWSRKCRRGIAVSLSGERVESLDKRFGIWIIMSNVVKVRAFFEGNGRRWLSPTLNIAMQFGEKAQ